MATRLDLSVEAEPPEDDIRNALTMLQTQQAVDPLPAEWARTLSASIARMQAALRKIDKQARTCWNCDAEIRP